MARSNPSKKGLIGHGFGTKCGPTFAGEIARQKTNDAIMNLVVIEIEQQQDPITSKLLQGSLASIVEAYQVMNTWLTMPMIDGRRKQNKKKNEWNQENQKRQKPIR